MQSKVLLCSSNAISKKERWQPIQEQGGTKIEFYSIYIEKWFFFLVQNEIYIRIAVYWSFSMWVRKIFYKTTAKIIKFLIEFSHRKNVETILFETWEFVYLKYFTIGIVAGLLWTREISGSINEGNVLSICVINSFSEVCLWSHYVLH